MRGHERFTGVTLAVLASALAAALAGCGRQMPAPSPPATAAPESAAVATATSAATLAVSPTSVAPQRTEVPSPAATAPPLPSPTAPAPAGFPDQLFLGLPAGDCYNPMDLAADSDRGVAYVYCGSSPARRPLISVVDLAAGQVVRTMPLTATEPTGQARVLLLPGGEKLLLIDYYAEQLTVVDTATGALSPPIPEFRDGILSQDGRVLYALGAWGLRAYVTRELLAGRGAPLWSVAERFERIALAGDRVLVSALGPESRLAVFDAATGKQLAVAAAPDLAGGLAAGPDGGWAATAGGTEPAVLRFDAGLRLVAQSPSPYAYDIFYDGPRGRYVLSGYDPRREGKNFIVSLAAADLAEQPGFEWPGYNPPTVFVAAGEDRLAGLARAGEERLVLLDAATLAPVGRVALGITIEDLAVDASAGRLYVADNQDQVRVVDVTNGAVIATWDGASPIELDAANGRLYVNRPAGVEALDLATGRPEAAFGRRGAPAADPNRDLVYIVSNGITVHDRSGREIARWQSSFRDPQGFSPNPSAIRARVNPVTGYLAAVFDNGVPGSNGATYLQLYPPGEEKPISVPGTYSFVVDVVFGPDGETFVSYSPSKGLEAVQRLGPDGVETHRLLGRSGLLVLDPASRALYAIQEGAAARLDSETLALEAVYRGPLHLTGIASDGVAGRVYIRTDYSPTLSAMTLNGLQPPDTRPQPAAGIPADVSCQGLAVTPTAAGQRVYAAFGESLYRSSDGMAWQRLPVGSLPAAVQLVAATDGALFYTGIGGAGSDGVWRSTDGGDTWELLAQGLTDLRASQGVLARGADEAYFVSRSQGLLRWRSEPDRGSWEPAGESSRVEYGSYTLAPDGTLFLTAWQALRRSTDRGATWEELQPPSDSGMILGFSAAYSETRTVFGLYGDRGTEVVRSTDAGETWSRVELGIDLSSYAWPPQLAAAPGAVYLLLPQRYEGPPAALLRSIDEGMTWQVAPAGVADGVERVAAGPGDRLWLATRGGLRWVTAGAVPWTTPGRPLATRSPTAAPRPSPTPVPTPCAAVLGPEEDALARRFPMLGCPRGEVTQVAMARQLFERGTMIWRADTRVVYVLSSDGRWQAFDDAWTEGMPESDSGITPPEGRLQPVRGFGLVWRTRLGEPGAAVGWALEPEQGIAGAVQAWDGGELLRLGDADYVLLAGGLWR